MGAFDFNSRLTKAHLTSAAINAAIDTGMADRLLPDFTRNYLGASGLGHDCLRKIQLDWKEPIPPEPRTERIFARGRWFETYAADRLKDAGFRIVRQGPALEFSQLDGLFKGHADGIVIAGPEIEGINYPCLWEAKGLGSKGWTKLSKEGLSKYSPTYASQVALYQAYLDLTDNPAMFTAANMDTMELLHLPVPFNAARAQEASDRAVQIVRAQLAGELLPRVGIDDEDWRCRFCAHRKRCWEMAA